MFAGTGGHRTIATVLTARDNASDSLSEVEESGNRARDSMDETETSTQGLTQSFAVLGGATVALTGAMGALVQTHGSTEQTLARLEVVTGATQQEMDNLRQTAVNLGSQLPVSIGQASNALEQLAFAGFSAEESMAAASGVANLAVASVMSVGQSARAASSALRMFGMDADEAHQVTASMAAVFSESATNMQELNSVIERAGPVADTAGVSLNELAGAAGVLADQGIRASRAGTALENTIRNIATGTGQAEAALSELGLSLDDLTDDRGELRDLTTVFTTLDEEMEGLDGRAERLSIATELAGQRGARALLPLLDNADKLQEKLGAQYRSEVQESIGQLSRLSEEEIEGVETALGGMEIDPNEVTPQVLFDRFAQFAEEGESVEDVAARIEASLNVSGQAAEHFAEGLVSGEASADQFASAIGEATTASELAAEQMDTTAGTMQFLRSSVDAFTFSVHGGASPAIKSFNGALASGINVINEHRSVGAALGAVMVGLTGAVGLATLGLGALIVNLKIAHLQQGQLLASTTTYTAAVKAQTVALAAASKAKWLMTASTSTLAAALMAEVNITRANIASKFSLASVSGGLTAALSAEMNITRANIAAKLSSASAAGVLAAAKGALTTAAFGAAAGVTALWTALGPVGWAVLGITAAVAALVAIWKGDFFGASSEAGALLGWFGEKAGQAWSVTKQLVGILFELGRIGATIAGLSLIAPFAALLKLPGLIKDVGPGIRQAAMNLPGSLIDGLDSLGPAAYAIPIIGPLWGLYDFVTSFGPKLKDAAMNLPPSIIDGLDSLGPAAYAIPIIGPLWGLYDFVTDPGKWVEAGKQIPTMIKQGIKSAASAPADAIEGVVSDARAYLPFSDAQTGPLSSLSQSGPALIHTVAGGIEDEGDTLPSVLSGALGGLPLPQAGGGPGAGGPAGLLSSTPLGQVAGSVAGGGNSAGQRPIKLEFHQDIDVNGDGEMTEEQVGQAAAEGVEEGVSNSDLDKFLEKLARETNN